MQVLRGNGCGVQPLAGDVARTIAILRLGIGTRALL